ncbi:hypothetical protein C8A05DRAFT_17684 [Staphylotrichum tortipilum]|uniref:C2H2-type domain-containing protein n=1 Tax=Staphylotrichum tortipilum TaxID=2831512 RepID=A0AAN6MH04_9PEZI|nr:hypothetical protein C8A05DRAFT_17684 [Staphylotrichum longicolle]
MALTQSAPNTLARQHQPQPQHQPQHRYPFNFHARPNQQPQQQQQEHLLFLHHHHHQHQQLQQQAEPYLPPALYHHHQKHPDLDLDFDLDLEFKNPGLQIDVDLGFGLDFDSSHRSLSSSPASTQSLPSRYPSLVSSPLTALDGLPTPVLAESSLFAASQRSTRALVAASDAMQTETWMPSGGQVTPRSVGPFSHQRDSSRSSMGSNGPMSPFPHNLANPQIAATNDSAADAFHGLPAADELNNYQLAAKAFPSVPHDSFYAIHPGYASSTHGAATTTSAAMANYPYLATAPRRTDAGRALFPPSGHPIGPGRTQPVSHPASVASSIAADSPATPAGEPAAEEDRKRTIGELSPYFVVGPSRASSASAPRSPFPNDLALGLAPVPVPTLDRTMTDAYTDELLSPDFALASASSSGPASISPTSEVFNQRLQAANQRLTAVSNSPVSATSRDRSPFRQGSPLAPLPMHDFPPSAMGPSQVRFGSAQQLREQNKAVLDAQAMAHQQLSRSVAATSTPQTISPRDAMLDFHESDADASANFPPLFPPSNNTGFGTGAMNKAAAAQSQQAFAGLPLDNNGFNNFLAATSMPTSMQMPQPYVFGAGQRPPSTVPSVATTRLGSADTSMTGSVYGGTPPRPEARPEDDTYTCTYHGCKLRFASPFLLQKHKREGHRHPHGLAARRGDVGGMASSMLNTQAGPHRCDRINPSTGKPCNGVFSRPYDLTRHEDTIHNAKKQKVRCDLCTDEKTFSRADALTRHYRVCHPDVEIPGQKRRRAPHSG